MILIFCPCTDIESPEITCPEDRDVIVENRGDSWAIVHIDPNNADVEENSNEYTVTVNVSFLLIVAFGKTVTRW